MMTDEVDFESTKQLPCSLHLLMTINRYKIFLINRVKIILFFKFM